MVGWLAQSKEVTVATQLAIVSTQQHSVVSLSDKTLVLFLDPVKIEIGKALLLSPCRLKRASSLRVALAAFIDNENAEEAPTLKPHRHPPLRRNRKWLGKSPVGNIHT